MAVSNFTVAMACACIPAFFYLTGAVLALGAGRHLSMAGLESVALALARGAIAAVALTKMWKEGSTSISEGRGWEYRVLGGGCLLFGAASLQTVHLFAQAIWACLTGEGDPVGRPLLSREQLTNEVRLGGGGSNSSKHEAPVGPSPRSTLLAGTAGVCSHAIPAGFALYLVTIDSQVSGVLLACALSLHTGLVGFGLCLPFPVSSVHVTLLDLGSVALGAFSPALGVALAHSLPHSVLNNSLAKGIILCFASGVLLALAVTHLSPDTCASSGGSSAGRASSVLDNGGDGESYVEGLTHHPDQSHGHGHSHDRSRHGALARWVELAAIVMSSALIFAV